MHVYSQVYQSLHVFKCSLLNGADAVSPQRSKPEKDTYIITWSQTCSPFHQGLQCHRMMLI